MGKPSQIQPLGYSSKFVHGAIVAPSGWGKTVFCGSAPKALFLTTDPEGTLSAKAVWGDACDADEWVIRSWQDLEDAVKWLRDEGHKIYNWVVVDNMTEAQNLAKQMNRDLAVKNNQKRAPYKFALDDYGVAQEAISQLVLRVHDIPIHTLWTIHIKGREDPDGNDYYSAAIQGKDGEVAEKVLGYMNIIGMGQVITKDDKEIRRLWFTHHNEFRGKDRFNTLGRFRDDLTVPRMMSILQKSGAIKTPKARTTTTPAANRKKA